MPANTETLDYGVTGQTLYAAIRSRATGQWWNGSALAAYADANWASYAVAMPEIGTSRVYLFTAPAGLPAGDYDLFASLQSGGTPVLGDPPISTLSDHWDGTNLTPLAPVAVVPEFALTPFQVGSLRFLRNRWTLISGAGGERLRVYAEDGTTGDFSGVVTRDANLAINSFTPDTTFVP